MKKALLGMALSVLCVLGVVGFPVQTEAAAQEMGYVNLQVVFSAHPNVAAAGETIKAEQQKAQQEYNDKSAGLEDNDKAVLERELNQRLATIQMEVMQPIRDSVIKSIAKAAKDKGVIYVVNADGMLYGGVDLTKDVIAILQQK